MNALLQYDIEDLTVGSEIDDPSVRKVLTKFLQKNSQKFTMQQLTTMLGVTPAFIGSVLTIEQLRRLGRRPAATILILRDYDRLQEDTEGRVWE